MTMQQTQKKFTPWWLIIGAVFVIVGVITHTTWLWGIGLAFIAMPVAFLLTFGVLFVIASVIDTISASHRKRQVTNLGTETKNISLEMKKIQAKYEGKNDHYSREAMRREIMALYKNNGTQ